MVGSIFHLIPRVPRQAAALWTGYYTSSRRVRRDCTSGFAAESGTRYLESNLSARHSPTKSGADALGGQHSLWLPLGDVRAESPDRFRHHGDITTASGKRDRNANVRGRPADAALVNWAYVK